MHPGNRSLDPVAERMKTGARRLDLALDEEILARLVTYFHELKKWNEKINLVARADDEQLIEVHFLDSLTLLPLLNTAPLPSRLLDIGSGAGFPGLVIKAALPSLPVTLVEPRQKRASFLKHIIRTLQLNDAQVLSCRIEDLADPIFFSHITCRGLTRIDEFLDLASRFSPPGGRLIAMKGPKGHQELQDWQAKKSLSPWEFLEIKHVRLPFSGAERFLFVFCKRSDQRRERGGEDEA